MKYKTVVFTDVKKVEFTEIETGALKPGEILVKTKKTMISTGTELSILCREGIEKECVWTSYGAYPFYPGYNNVGVVIDVADEKDRHLLGKRVLSYVPHARYGILNSEEDLTVLPDEIDDEDALFTVFGQIVLQGIRRGRVVMGETAVVYGAGLLGQITVDFLRLSGCARVVVCDTAEKRLSLITKIPIVTTVNPLKESVKDVVYNVTKGRMADVVFELTGVGPLIPKEMECLHDLGRLVILSSPRGETTMDFHDFVNRTSTEIIGAHNMSHTPVATLNDPWDKARDNEFFMDTVINGFIDVKRLISHREPYTKAIELYKMLIEDRPNAMGVLMDWDI